MSSRDDPPPHETPPPREAPLPVVDLGFGDSGPAAGPGSEDGVRSVAAPGVTAPPSAPRASSAPPESPEPAESPPPEEPPAVQGSPEGAESPDKRVRELIRGKELTQRRRIGERTLRRVGGRSWERPNVCFSDRLFKRLGANDPWDPDGNRREAKPIGLGPVGLKLGDKRRQPAPHLRPKAPKKKKSAQQAVDPIARFRNLPPAPSPSPAPAPRAAPRPAPSPAPAPPQPPRSSSGRATNPAVTRRKLSGEFGGSTGPKPLVGKLPMRPDLEGGPEAPPAKSGPSGAPSRGARRPAPRPSPRAAARPAPARSPAPAPARSAAPPESDAPRKPVRPPPPKLPGPPGPSRKRRTNRFRMKPTEARGPVIREKAVSPVKVLELVDDGSAPPAPAPAPAAVNRSAPSGPLGLDDLFGGSGGEKPTRMRIRRSKKPSPEATSASEDGTE